MEKNYEVGNFITTLRKEKKLTQAKLGELVGVSNKAISKWENGSGLPEPKYMSKLCEVLEITVDELLNGKRNPVLENEILDDLSRLEHVYKYYNNDSRIEIGLKDINLSFKLGERIAVTGVSGSGKSTLINMIGGIDSFEDGEIYVNNEGISKYDSLDYENYRKKYISFIFQDYGILESYSILDNLILVRLLMGDSYKESKKKALDILKKIGFLKFKNKKASKLSGGQKQKLSVARAILKDTPIILGDEITANLDSTSGKELLGLLFSNAENKLIILVTHHYEEIEKYVTRKITLSEGMLIEDKKIRNAPFSNYIPTTTEAKLNEIRLGLMVAIKQLKSNFLGMVVLFMSILFCAILLFGGNILFDYAIGDADRGYDAKKSELIEVQSYDQTLLNMNHFNELKNIKNVEQVLLPEFYSLSFYVCNIYDKNMGTFKISIDDSLSFGEAIINSNKRGTGIDTIVEEEYFFIDLANHSRSKRFLLRCKDVNYILNDTSLLSLSAETYVFIQQVYRSSSTFTINNAEKEIHFAFGNMMDLQLYIDLTEVYEGVYVPKNFLNIFGFFNGNLEDIPEQPIVECDGKFQGDLILTDQSVAFVSYSFYNGIGFNEKTFYLVCPSEKVLQTEKLIKNLGYRTYIRQNEEFPLGDDNLFYSNTSFWGIDIAATFLLYLLLMVTNMKILKTRKKEFLILKKNGFSDKSIYVHMISQILASCILITLFSGFIYLVRPFILWYYYVIPLCSLWSITYFLCRHIHIKYNTILKEGK